MVKKSLCLALLLAAFSSPASAGDLVCFIVKSVGFGQGGPGLDVLASREDDRKDPRNYNVFDLSDMEVSIFLEEEGGKRKRIVERMTRISPQLFYSAGEMDGYMVYSTYLFEADMTRGILTEERFVSVLECVSESEAEFERKNGVMFSEYSL